MKHPTLEELEALSRGHLAPELRTRISDHVGGCSECSARMFELSRSATAESEATPAISPPTSPAGPKPLERGAQVGRYVVLDVLGSGGMGVVYAAWDPELDRRVAIKLLQATGGGSSDASGQASLLREAQAQAKLAHPNVVAVHDVGVLDGDRVFVALELVEGQTLHRWLKEPRSLRERVRVFLAAGEGLAAAHAAGLVHGDFKPENVLVGNDGRARVMDFGLAHLQQGEAEATQAGLPEVVVGTPAYMAPELYTRGTADARSDQFAFGVSLYAALFGDRPFKTRYADRPADARWRIDPLPPGAPRVPGWLKRIAIRAMAERPEDRFPSMSALLVELADDPALKRRRWAFAAVGVLAVVGAVVGMRASAERHSQICKGAERRLAGIWDEGTRAAVRSAFLASGNPLAADLLARVEARLDAYARAWVSQRTDACEATRLRGEQSEEALSLRMECLDGRAMELDELVGLLRHSDAKGVNRAVQAVSGLSELSACADLASLRARIPPPTREAKETVRALRDRLAGAKARFNLGDVAEAEKQAAGIVGQAKQLGYLPLLAEADMQLGLIHDADKDSALEDYAQAMNAAEAGHDDELFSAAISRRTHLLANLQRFPDVAQWLPLTEAVVDRAGRPIGDVLNLASARASLQISQKKDAEAMETVRATMAQVRATLAPDDPVYGTAVGWMGAMCLNAGDLDCAVQAGEQGVAARTALLGPRHPNTAIAVLNLCASELETARWARGAEHCKSAYQLLGTAYAKEGIIYGIAAGNYGQALQSLGRFDEARPLLQEAAAVLEKIGARNPNRCDQLESLVELDLEQRRPELLADDVHALLACRPTPVVTEREGARALASEAALELSEGKTGAAVQKLESVVAASHPGPRASERFEAGLYRFLLAEALEKQRPRSDRARQLAADGEQRFDGIGRGFWRDEVARWLTSNGAPAH